MQGVDYLSSTSVGGCDMLVRLFVVGRASFGHNPLMTDFISSSPSFTTVYYSFFYNSSSKSTHPYALS